VTIKAQIAGLHAGIEAFAACVASLSEELFVRKCNGWSPRDIVAHLIGWNRYIIKGSTQIKNGELPFYDLDPGENYSKVNAVLIRVYSSNDKQELLKELQDSVRELEEFLQSLPPKEWDHDYGVRHRGVPITIRNSVDEVIEDYAHHKEQIENWVNRSGRAF